VSDRTPTPGTTHGDRIGEMASPLATEQHKLKGMCPDGLACTLPVHCSQLCSRLQPGAIAAELQAQARAAAHGVKLL